MKLLTTSSQLQNKINTALKPKINDKMSNLASHITPEVRKLIHEAIVRQPAWQSILNGRLHYHFGLLDRVSKLSRILDIWVNSVHVQFLPARVIGGIISSTLRLVAIRSSYNDVLSLSEAKQITEKNESLPWLRWLLLMGDEAVIKKYHIKVGPSEASRTGKAIMIKKGIWKVPTEYSGIAEKNMITDAVDEIESDVLFLLKKAFK